jgi:MarR-like DNA-binding transcriptional regulator SgrR of sgrS sRNA
MSGRLTTDPDLLRETATSMNAFRRHHGRYPFGRELADLLDLAPVTAHLRMRSAAHAGLVKWKPQRGRGDRKPVLRPAGPLRQLTVDEVREIRTRRAAGELLADLARRFEVTEACVSFIVNRRSWRHIA